jgi:hypothetical protein
MKSINFTYRGVCMLMMIKRSISLIRGETVLWNGNRVRRVAKWLRVEMGKQVTLISCLSQQM